MQAKDSFWITDTFYNFYDFLIIGNGFTGMQTALQIKKKYPNKKVGIADKYFISQGASLRNAGFACFGSVSEILDDISSLNKTGVYDLVALRFQGLNYLTEDFTPFNYHQGNAQEVFLESETEQYTNCLNELNKVNQSMKAITGLETTFTKTKQTLHSSFKDLAISNELEGHLHTGMLYHQMKSRVIASGITWIGDFNVVNVDRQQNGFSVTSDTSKTIRSEQVISCLNAFSHSLINNPQLEPARGQIIVTKSLKNNPLSGIVHADKGYIYARPLENRILIGGARNRDIKTENTFEFDENKGQFNKTVKYHCKLHIGDIYFKPSDSEGDILALMIDSVEVKEGDTALPVTPDIKREISN